MSCVPSGWRASEGYEVAATLIAVVAERVAPGPPGPLTLVRSTWPKKSLSTATKAPCPLESPKSTAAWIVKPMVLALTFRKAVMLASDGVLARRPDFGMEKTDSSLNEPIPEVKLLVP